MNNKATMRRATLRDLIPEHCSVVVDCDGKKTTLQLKDSDYLWFDKVRKSACSFGISLSEKGLEVFFSVKMEYTCNFSEHSIFIAVKDPSESDNSLVSETLTEYSDPNLVIKTRSDGKTTFQVTLGVSIVKRESLDSELQKGMYPDFDLISDR